MKQKVNSSKEMVKKAQMVEQEISTRRAQVQIPAHIVWELEMVNKYEIVHNLN